MNMYREHKVYHGNYQGTYRIYWNADACREHENNVRIKRWRFDELEIGDWVESDDGTVAQLLDIKVSKGNKPVYFYRFAFTTVTSYKYTNKEGINIHKYNKFNANYTPINSSSVSTIYPERANSKIRFATYIALGINPTKAYQMVYFNWSKKFSSKTSLQRKATNMIKDKVVKQELMNQLSEFRDKLNSKFNDEIIIAHIEELLSFSKKGSREHRENIQFVLEMLGKKEMKDDSNAVDAEYEEVKPPMLQ